MNAKEFRRRFVEGARNGDAAQPDSPEPQRHTGLRNAILEVLHVNGIPAAPLWTGEGKLERGGYVRSGRRGWPDIIGHLPDGWGAYSGRALYVEVKVGGDERREEQHEFAATAQSAGCVYLVVRDSVADIMERLCALPLDTPR